MDDLGIVVKVDGTLETSNGLKLVSSSTKDLGKELDALNSKTGGVSQTQKTIADGNKAISSTAQDASKNLARVGAELARGDFKGAAIEMGKLALGGELLTASTLGVLGVIGAVVLGVGALGMAASQGAQEERALNDSLILTGNYAGLVAGQLDTMSSSLARGVGSSVANSRSVLAGLTSTGRFTVDSLGSVAEAVQLVARFSGQTNEQVLKNFSSMGDGIAKWAAKANESYHFLDIETFRYISRLEEQGRSQDAMRVTSEALSKHLGNDLTRNLGFVDRAWQAITRSASDAWTAMKSVGKESSSDEILGKGLDYAARARTGWMAQTVKGQQEGTSRDDRNRGLFRRSELEKSSATSRSAQEQEQQRLIELAQNWGKVQEANRTKTQQLTAELKKARETGEAAGADEKEIAAAERKIRERYATKTPKTQSNESEAFLANQERQLRSLAGEASAYEDALQKIALSKGKISASDAEEMKANGLKIDQGKALRQLTEDRIKFERQADEDAKARQKELDTISSATQKLQEQAAQVGLTKAQIDALKASRLDHVISMERERMAEIAQMDNSEKQVQFMQDKIALLEKQRDAEMSLGQRVAQNDLAKEQQELTKKFGDDAQRDLKEGLIRGFEAGKSPAGALADTLGAMIKQRLVSSFADSILNTFEPLFRQVLARANLGSVGSSNGLGGLLNGVINMVTGGGGATVQSETQMGSSFASDFGRYLVPSAKGNAFAMSGVQKFAKGSAFLNSVVSSPTLFKFAQGTGLMGEAGPEAIMPLRRGSDGSLGVVAAGGGGAAVNVSVNVQTMPGTSASVKQRSGADGAVQIDVMIHELTSALADGVANGSGPLAGAIESRYGLRTAVS